jgi:tRNA threonylcarbamoyladenosine biosynthesis protein TsaE
MQKLNKYILNEDDIHIVIEELKLKIKNRNIVVLLQGDLASGKTTLVKNYVKFLGIDDKVTSPTFSLQSIYSNNIFHYDVYNKTLAEFISLGLLEEFEKDGIHFVEWGDDKLLNLLNEYGFNTKVVKIKKLNDKREYKISV